MGHSRSTFAILAWMLAALLVTSSAVAAGKPYEYVPPEPTHDGWETAALSDEKMDADLIRALFDRILSGGYKNVNSVVVAKDGKLVIEEYFPRQDVIPEQRARALKRVAPQQLYSATKSVTSILIGLAIEQRLIRGVDEPVSAFFPEYADLFADAQRGRIRLKDFLTMSAGLSWDEWSFAYADPRNDAMRALLNPDPIRSILGRPIVAPPGATFTYNTGISVALGEIVRKASGLPADAFAARNLFEPLGISDYYWSKVPGDRHDIVETSGGLFLRPRDVAKLGQLFLDGGRWRGKQIIGEQWVRESTTNHMPPGAAGKLPAWVQAEGYGYQWWLSTFRAGDRSVPSYSARGRGGQFIFVFPDQHLIAVFTGLNDNILMNQPLDMLQRFILPAAGALPEPGASTRPTTSTAQSH